MMLTKLWGRAMTPVPNRRREGIRQGNRAGPAMKKGGTWGLIEREAGR